MHIKTWESSLPQISLLLADLSFQSLADLYAKYVGLSDDSPWIDNDLFDLENNQTYYCYSYMCQLVLTKSPIFSSCLQATVSGVGK